jgi:hypothetical protein
MLTASDTAFTFAPLRAGADESASDAARVAAKEAILRSFGKLHSAAVELKAATSRAVNIHWLANHTQGANWDTVAQLVHREGVDAYMSAVTDDYTPISSWDERVKIAMKEARQEQHLAKDGPPLPLQRVIGGVSQGRLSPPAPSPTRAIGRCKSG